MCARLTWLYIEFLDFCIVARTGAERGDTGTVSDFILVAFVADLLVLEQQFQEAFRRRVEWAAIV